MGRYYQKIKTFRKNGPFEYEIIENYNISLSPTNNLTTDLFIPQTKSKSPLIIMVHGNKFSKEVHKNQGKRIASWGFHCLIVGVPNQGQWIKNGLSITYLTKLIYDYPNIISSNIDRTKIILVGHSFGGSAVTIAAGRNAPVAGLILLDPAVVHKSIRKYMTKINTPVVLLGADPNVFTSRKRKLFFNNIAGPMTEVTITGATHNDAQSPSITKVIWGFDPFTTAKYQETFLQAIIASSFSLTTNNSVNYAWKAFRPYLKQGILKTGKIRQSKKHY
jgi:dienelactone hydrolase